MMNARDSVIQRTREKEGQSMTLEQLIDHFLRSGKIEGKSAATLEWYKFRLARFIAYLRSQSHSLLITQVVQHDGERYITSLIEQKVRWGNHPHHKPHEGEGLSMHTVHSHVRAIRSLMNWAVDQQYLPSSPFVKLPVPRLPKRLYEILTETDIQSVLTSLDERGEEGMRQRMIFLLTLDTGMRARELLDLRMNNIDLKQGMIKVLGKGNKERYIPIGQAAQKEILTYNNFYRRNPVKSAEDHLLLTADGHPMTYSALASIMRRIRAKSGLKRLHMHKLRHTCLTMMVERGTPSFVVQQFAGHASISTTESYVHLAQQRTAYRYQNASVVDGLATVQNASRRGRRSRQTNDQE